MIELSCIGTPREASPLEAETIIFKRSGGLARCEFTVLLIRVSRVMLCARVGGETPANGEQGDDESARWLLRFIHLGGLSSFFFFIWMSDELL